MSDDERLERLAQFDRENRADVVAAILAVLSPRLLSHPAELAVALRWTASFLDTVAALEAPDE